MVSLRKQIRKHNKATKKARIQQQFAPPTTFSAENVEDMNCETIDYPKCPRCQGEWGMKIYLTRQCIKCDLMYVYANKRFRLFFDESELLWRLDKQDCIWWKDGFMEGKPLILPMLPFDITLEKLKLYVVFS